MPKAFDHPMQPVISSYPQISAAARSITRQVLGDLNWRAKTVNETWKPGVVCAVCGQGHDQQPLNIFPALGKPMDAHSREKMLLEEVVRALSRMI